MFVMGRTSGEILRLVWELRFPIPLCRLGGNYIANKVASANGGQFWQSVG